MGLGARVTKKSSMSVFTELGWMTSMMYWFGQRSIATLLFASVVEMITPLEASRVRSAGQ